MCPICRHPWWWHLQNKKQMARWWPSPKIYIYIMYSRYIAVVYIPELDISVVCWTPFLAWYFSRNRGNYLNPIRGKQFFAKSAHRDRFCSRFAGDHFSRNQACQSILTGTPVHRSRRVHKNINVVRFSNGLSPLLEISTTVDKNINGPLMKISTV